MADPHQNFAYSTIATAPSPATSGTSITLASGEGSRFPDPASVGAYNCTIWAVNEVPTPDNAEIVRVTAISTDTLTITRAQESSTARTVVIGDQIAMTITKKTLTDAEIREMAIRLYSGLTAGTVNINSTSYGTAIPFEFTVDLDWFPFTDYKITLVGQASEAAQTITLQLATFATPTTPIHTGGDDLVVTNGFAAFDSGWKSRDDGSTGSKTYRIVGKGSNSTVDFAVTWCQIDLRIVPS